MKNNNKTFVLGLDGATWDLLNPLMDKGLMPNLKKIIKKGASSVLQSTIPPYTAPAWVSCFTGVNPGKHGIFGFTIKKNGVPGKQFVGSNYVRVPKLWHYINSADKTVGLINIPITYPAEPVNGFVVPCFLTPLGKKDYTYPKSIYKDYLLPIDYVINVRIAEKQDFSEKIFLKIINDIKHSTQKRYEAMDALRNAYNPDFFMIVFTCMDKIQHKFWKFLDPRNPIYSTSIASQARPFIISLYEQMDEIIGKILMSLDDNTTLYIVSDHGFGPKKKMFLINKWLEKNGLLKINKLKLIKHRFLSNHMIKHDFSNRNIDILNHPIYNFIDFNKSLFLGSDPYEQGIYYIGVSNDKKYMLEINKLKNKLKELKDPETGIRIFDEVYFRNDLYEGDYTHIAPDIILKMKDYGYDIARTYPLRNKFLNSVNKPAGCHQPEGIFAAYGKNIIACNNFNASIIDITPTVLYHMGLPVHRNMDGRVINEIFSTSFQKDNQVQYTDATPSYNIERDDEQEFGYSEKEKTEIASRLKDLGYFD
ncbi:MAG: alkaline phosphatase family protein [Proteobacteria bacterium]|nr:alkaline phosphatase family protein [Pseudomonadota bacterium]